MKKINIFLMFTFIVLSFFTVNISFFAEELDSDITSITVHPAVNKYEKRSYDNLNSSYTINTPLDGDFTYYDESRGEVGRLEVSGDISSSNSTYQGIPAIGASSPISFSYAFDKNYSHYYGSTDTQWTLKTESNTKIVDYTDLDENGIETTINIGGSIKRGAIVIQKKSNLEDNYTTISPSFVNYFDNYDDDDRIFYTTSGEDLNEGTFYRYMVVYTMGKYDYKPFFGDIVYDYYKCVETYEFYVINDTGTIAIHNNSINSDIFEDVEGFTSEQLIKGETLKDGSVTTDGFTIDKLGINNDVYVKKDEEENELVEDQSSFTENGKYKITVETKLGLIIEYTIFIFNGGNDFGFSTYFEDFIVAGRRLLASTPYPAYEKDSKLFIREVNDFIPLLSGYLENVSTGEIIEINQSTSGFSYTLGVGEYECILYNSGTEDTGSYYEYKFNFYIIDDKSEPNVNYNTLFTRTMFKDLQSKHYEVAYQTTRGGYIFVCFSIDSYNEAKSYAYEIEKRFIENVDGNKYYKSLDNPNRKDLYYHDEDLLNALYYYAEQNIEIAYFNTLDEFTSRTYDNDLLSRLDELNLETSIRVFPNQDELNKMSEPTSFDEKIPFINGYSFVQIADFDVETVYAYCHRNGITYNLNFDISVDNQLNVSSVYTITETNVYGVTRTYDVIFCSENSSVVNFSYEYNNQSFNSSVSSINMINGMYYVTADIFQFISTSNALDDSSIVTIKAPGVYSFEIKCLLSELNNTILYKEGIYEINFIDRLGNKMTIHLTLTGNSRYDGINNISYTSLYNSIYNTKQAVNEENFIDDKILYRLLNNQHNSSLFPTNSLFNEYTALIEEGNSIYLNYDSTQNEIDIFIKKIEKFIYTIEGLDYIEELYSLLSYVDNLDNTLYSNENILKINDLYSELNLLLSSANIDHDYVKSIISELYDTLQNLQLSIEALESILVKVINLNCDLYTQSSLEKLNSIYDEGVKIYNNENSSKEEIEEVILKLMLSLDSLILLGDMKALNLILNEISTLDFNLYATSSINSLNILFEQANNMYILQDSSYDEVDEMIEQLRFCINNLAFCADVTDLELLINTIENIEYYLYTTESIRTLKNVYEEANNLLQFNLSLSEKLVINNKLSTAINNLVLCQYKVQLQDTLKNYTVPSNATNESLKEFVDIYNNALNTLHSEDDISEEELTNILNALSQSYDQIEIIESSSPSIILIILGIIAIIIVISVVIKVVIG